MKKVYDKDKDKGRTAQVIREKKQLEFNRRHGIVPESVRKEIRRGIEEILDAEKTVADAAGLSDGQYRSAEVIGELEKQMYEAARSLDFEEAARLRDIIGRVAGESGLSKKGPLKFKFVRSSKRRR